MTDIQIAQQAAPLPIGDIAAACGIDPQYLEQYGRYKAKIDYRLLRDRADRPDGKLHWITVSCIGVSWIGVSWIRATGHAGTLRSGGRGSAQRRRRPPRAAPDP